MVDFEAEVEGSTPKGPISGFAGQAASVASDVLELAELQARLAKAEALAAARGLTMPVAIIIVGGCAALASLPVLALGLASCLEHFTVLTTWQAQLLTGSIFAILSALTIYVSIRRIRKVATQFQRTAGEFEKNIAWIKCMLRGGGLEKTPSTQSPQFRR